MTFEEYDNTGWTGGMFCMYKNNKYEIGAANFPEYLVALVCDDDPDDYMWVRCENIEIVKL